jgi:hypothetical protein
VPWLRQTALSPPSPHLVRRVESGKGVRSR